MKQIDQIHIDDAFPSVVSTPPEMTLRGGNEIDSYKDAIPYDAEVDFPNDEYLEKYAFWGYIYLDYESWKYYLPIILKYALRHDKNNSNNGMVTETLLNSIRPPKENIYKLKLDNIEQHKIVMDALDIIAFSDEYSEAEYAMQIIQEVNDKWGV